MGYLIAVVQKFEQFIMVLHMLIKKRKLWYSIWIEDSCVVVRLLEYP